MKITRKENPTRAWKVWISEKGKECGFSPHLNIGDSLIQSQDYPITDSCDKASYIPRIARYGVGRATKYRSCAIMQSKFMTLTTPLTVHPSDWYRSVVNFVSYRQHVLLNVTDYFNQAGNSSPRNGLSLSTRTYHVLIKPFPLLATIAQLIILKVLLWGMKLALTMIRYLHPAASSRRIASSHVIYYPYSTPVQQLKPAFVSYVVSDKSSKDSQGKTPRNDARDLINQHDYKILRSKIYFENELEDLEAGDVILIAGSASESEIEAAEAFTAYKKVDRKVKPVSGTFPQEALVRRSFPHDPLEGLPVLSKNPPEFIPSQHITAERYEQMNINSEGFLRPEEEKLFAQVLLFNEKTLAFEETDRGTLREDYFSPYIMATIPHSAW
jgi:hypothetical protein